MTRHVPFAILLALSLNGAAAWRSDKSNASTSDTKPAAFGRRTTPWSSTGMLGLDHDDHFIDSVQLAGKKNVKKAPHSRKDDVPRFPETHPYGSGSFAFATGD